jgi:transcription termination factor Rho
MDEAIYKTQGHGQYGDSPLNRRIAERRIYPAIDINRSGNPS